MSEQAMQDAKINHLTQENNSLKTAIKNLSAQFRAARHCVDEYLNANIGLKTSLILMEETATQNQIDIKGLTERCRILEIEKSNIQAHLDEINKENEPAVAA